jgi:hypothetical protein
MQERKRQQINEKLRLFADTNVRNETAEEIRYKEMSARVITMRAELG